MMSNYLVHNDGEQRGRTALILAAKKGLHECVSILVSNGADVNAACRVRMVLRLTCLAFQSGYTVVHELSTSLITMFDCLVLDAREQKGWTALMVAAGRAHKECIRILVANGADVNMSMRVRI